MTKEMMRSVIITGPEQASLQEIERWVPETGEALVRCQAVAICTTERRFFAGLRKLYPVIGGHELSGIIEAVNEEDSNLKPGDRVVIDAVRRCGHCHYCVNGHSNHCLDMTKSKKRRGYVLTGGGFAEYTIAPASRMVKLPDHVDLEEASLVEPLACCIHSIKKAQLSFGDTVAVLGVGPMGVLHAMLAKLLGAKVIVSDIDEARLEFSRQLGVDTTVNAQVDDPVQVVKNYTEGRGADAVIVATGSRQVAEQGLAMTGKLGRIIFYASAYPPTSLDIDWNHIHYSEIIITGSKGKTEKDFHEAVKLLASGQVNLKPLISKTISLDELPAELGITPSGEIQRVVVKH